MQGGRNTNEGPSRALSEWGVSILHSVGQTLPAGNDTPLHFFSGISILGLFFGG